MDVSTAKWQRKQAKIKGYCIGEVTSLTPESGTVRVSPALDTQYTFATTELRDSVIVGNIVSFKPGATATNIRYQWASWDEVERIYKKLKER